MSYAPRLISVRTPANPMGAVIVLHGGASRGTKDVSASQLSVLRMVPIARRIAREGRARIAVFRLLNSQRGWDGTHTPVADVRWALSRLVSRLGRLPVCLVGHSLGGRAALLAGAEPPVVGVVALAPWLLPSDDMSALGEKPVLIVHGAKDRVASPARAALVARNLEGPVSFVVVAGAGHAMLRHHRRFSSAASTFVQTLLSTTSMQRS